MLETVLSFKNVTLDKLSEFSAQDLETKVKSFAISIKNMGIYGNFPNQMLILFHWTPEVKESEC